MTDELQIRAVVERWVAAIQARDLDGVLAAHTDDVVVFDVPPPYDGVHGIDAYRDTWPEFFEWIAGGAVLDLVTLDVTASDTVAYAHALFRSGTPEDIAAAPDKRLRSTFGLRKVDGAWVIAHEHHSLPQTA